MLLWEKVILCLGFGVFAAGLKGALDQPWHPGQNPPLPREADDRNHVGTTVQEVKIAIEQQKSVNGTAEVHSIRLPTFLQGTKKQPPIQEIFDYEMMLIASYSANGSKPPPRIITEKRCSTTFGPVCVSVDKQRGDKSSNKHKHLPYIKPVDNEHPVRIQVMGSEGHHRALICNEGDTKSVPLDGTRSPPPAEDSGVLVVVLCWDTYGYHLWACIMGVKAILALEKVTEDPKIAVLKAGFAPQRFGSHSSWNDKKSYNPRYMDAVQWGLWAAVSSQPSNVRSLRDWGGTCFKKAIVGHVPLFDITPTSSRATVESVLRTSGIDWQPATCGKPRITIVERKANLHITNLKDLSEYVQPLGEVRIVMFEDLPLKQQIEIAANTDLMIGTHGNGLTWAAFMNSGVLVEVWGEYPYNTNYRLMARRSNLRYIPVSLHQKGCKRRCDVNVSFNLLRPALVEAAEHLHNTSCAHAWYDADYLAQSWDEHLYTTGKRKRKRNKGMGSPPYLDSSNL